MTDTNPTPPERPDKDQEPKNHFFEAAKQKTIEFIRIATPIIQAGLKTAIRGIRHGITVGKERFMQLDRRRRVASVMGVLMLTLLSGWWLLSPTANGLDKANNSVQSPQSVPDQTIQGEIDKFCAAYGTDVKAVDKWGQTLLHKAARHDSLHVIQYLVKKGADVNVKDGEGETPFHAAASLNKNVDVLRFFIEKGVNINTRTNYGETPLHYAARRGKNGDILRFLVENGADVNAKAGDGDTPLHDAAKWNESVDALKFLVENGADVNAKNGFGKTPLHEAAEQNKNVDVLRLLVEKGANVNVKDGRGNTLLDLAKKNKNKDVLQYLFSVVNQPKNTQNNNEKSTWESKISEYVGRSIYLDKQFTLTLNKVRELIEKNGIAQDELNAILDETIKTLEKHGVIKEFLAKLLEIRISGQIEAKNNREKFNAFATAEEYGRVKSESFAKYLVSDGANQHGTALRINDMIGSFRVGTPASNYLKALDNGHLKFLYNGRETSIIMDNDKFKQMLMNSLNQDELQRLNRR